MWPEIASNDEEDVYTVRHSKIVIDVAETLKNHKIY